MILCIAVAIVYSTASQMTVAANAVANEPQHMKNAMRHSMSRRKSTHSPPHSRVGTSAAIAAAAPSGAICGTLTAIDVIISAVMPRSSDNTDAQIRMTGMIFFIHRYFNIHFIVCRVCGRKKLTNAICE